MAIVAPDRILPQSWYSYKLYKIQRPAFFHMLKDKGAHGFIFRSALPDNGTQNNLEHSPWSHG